MAIPTCEICSIKDEYYNDDISKTALSSCQKCDNKVMKTTNDKTKLIPLILTDLMDSLINYNIDKYYVKDGLSEGKIYKLIIDDIPEPSYEGRELNEILNIKSLLKSYNSIKQLYQNQSILIYYPIHYSNYRNIIDIRFKLDMFMMTRKQRLSVAHSRQGIKGHIVIEKWMDDPIYIQSIMETNPALLDIISDEKYQDDMASIIIATDYVTNIMTLSDERLESKIINNTHRALMPNSKVKDCYEQSLSVVEFLDSFLFYYKWAFALIDGIGHTWVLAFLKEHWFSQSGYYKKDGTYVEIGFSRPDDGKGQFNEYAIKIKKDEKYPYITLDPRARSMGIGRKCDACYGTEDTIFNFSRKIRDKVFNIF